MGYRLRDLKGRRPTPDLHLQRVDEGAWQFISIDLSPTANHARDKDR